MDYNPTDFLFLEEEASAAEDLVDPTNGKGVWNGERPMEPASRAEVAVMLNRAVNAAVAKAVASTPKVVAAEATVNKSTVRAAVRDEQQYLTNLVKAEIAKDLTS